MSCSSLRRSRPLILWNGGLCPLPQGLSRAARFGDGFFETMRLHGDTLLFLSHHVRRIQQAARRLNLILPSELRAEALTQQVVRLCREMHIGLHGRVRLTVFRQGAGTYLPESMHADWWLEVHPLNDFYNPDVQAVAACFFRQMVKDFSYLSGFKNIGSAVYVLASVHAARKGCHEAILFNSLDEVVETTSSNLFVFRNDTLFTPPLRSGCIAGILRRVLLEFARRYGLKVKIKSLKSSELLGAEEMFATNVVRGIVPIGRLAGRTYDTSRTRRLARNFYSWLAKAYQC
ncbi:MAG: aminotransferase class IV [Chitinophagales bacterium]|nr:aminotransferase class IV [Chitinophagales bacterium]MDW8427492.1 aminotransferase class IV [Chitinophagales bacterium]